tara:strand:- start:18 stop:452 length:435 start_codon:yes stop_codon:yes gene_type:complete
MWEDILKRRPLRINKPELSEEEISNIKKQLLHFIGQVRIVELYVRSLETKKPKHNLEYALRISLDYEIQAGPTVDKYRQSIEDEYISFNNIILTIIKSLKKQRRNDLIEGKDKIIINKLIQVIDAFYVRHKNYFDEQDRTRPIV